MRNHKLLWNWRTTASWKSLGWKIPLKPSPGMGTAPPPGQDSPFGKKCSQYPNADGTKAGVTETAAPQQSPKHTQRPFLTFQTPLFAPQSLQFIFPSFSGCSLTQDTWWFACMKHRWRFRSIADIPTSGLEESGWAEQVAIDISVSCSVCRGSAPSLASLAASRGQTNH